MRALFLNIHARRRILYEPQDLLRGEGCETFHARAPDEGEQRGRKAHGHRWKIPSYEDRYGFYEMEPILSDEYGNYLTDVYLGELAQLGWLEHYWKRGEYDDWTIDFNWNSGLDLDGDGVDDPYFLDGWTRHTPEEEGIYDPITDTWTVTFNEAYFDIDCGDLEEIMANMLSGMGT